MNKDNLVETYGTKTITTSRTLRTFNGESSPYILKHIITSNNDHEILTRFNYSTLTQPDAIIIYTTKFEKFAHLRE